MQEDVDSYAETWFVIITIISQPLPNILKIIWMT